MAGDPRMDEPYARGVRALCTGDACVASMMEGDRR